MKNKILLSAFFIIALFFTDTILLFSQTDSTYILPDLIPYRKGDKWGFCDKNKKVIIQCKYDEVYLFKKGTAYVEISKRKFLINKNDSIIKEIKVKEIFKKYDNYEFFGYGFYLVKKNGMYGIIDTLDNIILPIIYDEIRHFWCGYSEIRLNKKSGIIDTTGKLIIPIIYEHVFLENPNEKLFIAKFDKKEGVINDKNDIIIPLKYKHIRECNDNLYIVKLNYKYGYLNKNGKIEIPLIYNDAHYFSEEGLACVRKGSKYGFINKKGEVVIPFIYDEGNSFYKGFAKVRINDKDGFIDTKGNVAFPFIYGRVKGHLTDEYMIVTKFSDQGFDGYRDGIIDKKGNIIIDFKYRFIVDAGNRLVRVYLNHKYGYIDLN